MIYGIDRAAAKAGLSRRHFTRLAQELGKTRVWIGLRQKYLFTDQDLAEIEAHRQAKHDNPVRKRSKPYPRKNTH